MAKGLLGLNNKLGLAFIVHTSLLMLSLVAFSLTWAYPIGNVFISFMLFYSLVNTKSADAAQITLILWVVVFLSDLFVLIAFSDDLIDSPVHSGWAKFSLSFAIINFIFKPVYAFVTFQEAQNRANSVNPEGGDDSDASDDEEAQKKKSKSKSKKKKKKKGGDDSDEEDSDEDDGKKSKKKKKKESKKKSKDDSDDEDEDDSEDDKRSKSSSSSKKHKSAKKKRKDDSDDDSD